MLRSPPDAHDDHLRLLLDQRTTRAEVHGRFSALSQFSDTPSVYSRAVFSPEGNYSYRSSSPYAAEVFPNHDEPAVSMLDLDDDPRSSFASSDNHDHNYSHSFDNEDDNEPLPRMSYLGPKMRFHSRAPWELDEATLEEEEEVEESPRHFASGFPFSRGNGPRSATSDSPSPQPSNGSRPSEESSRSQASHKPSIESTSSQISYPRGALYALAQESLSTSSLGRPSNSGQKEGFRGNFSIGRVRSRSPAARAIPSPSLSPTCTPVHPSFPPQTFLQNGHHDETCLPAESDSYRTRYPARPSSSSSSEDDRHPYANPDLVISYAVEPLPKSPLRSAMQFPPRNDSNLTVTDSFTTLTLSNSGTRSTLSSDSLSTSSFSRDRLSSLQGRDISSPVSAHSTSKDEQVLPVPPPGVVNLPGWTDRATAPAFSLISLEEARAQRMHGSSSHDAASRSSNGSALSSMTPFSNGEHETTNIADVPSSGGTTSRTRGRTISAGAKAKNALQTIVGQKPDRRGSEPAVFGNQPTLGAQPNKTLKHKKSGFMRLFNGGKANEKDETEAPPVPSLSDAYAALNQHHSRKATLHRIPVPSISPSMFEASPVHDNMSSLGDSSTSVSASPNPRRTPPSLHINTLSRGPVPQGAASARGGDEFHPRRTLPASSSETPWQIESQPQSAPANVSQFPSLKLRPVSTLFSTHFADHIVSDPQPIYETDLDTPRSSSPTGLVSPVTPASYSRPSNEQASKTYISGDSSSLVQALQEQIISAKKASQQHIWELEGQVRDLKAEVEELKASGKDNTFCSTCGRGEKRSPDGPKHDILSASGAGSVVNRPRARTGTSSRFGNAMP